MVGGGAVAMMVSERLHSACFWYLRKIMSVSKGEQSDANANATIANLKREVKREKAATATRNQLVKVGHRVLFE
jgi:hypothetical protein